MTNPTRITYRRADGRFVTERVAHAYKSMDPWSLPGFVTVSGARVARIDVLLFD